MTALLLAVFGASLAGSLHCVGMCGPFALLAASRNPQRRDGCGEGGSCNSLASLAFFYHAGRLLTYAAVGIVCGAAGMALNNATTRWGTSASFFQQTATWVAGLLMIAVGGVAILRLSGWKLRFFPIARKLNQRLASLYRKVSVLSPVKRAIVIGMLASLMPCGWLYTFAITAAGTGDPMLGAIVMATFWAGSVPALLGVVPIAAIIKRTGNRAAKAIPWAMAGLIVLTGVFTLAFRAPVDAFIDREVVTGVDNLSAQVSTIDQKDLPCCHGEGK